MSQEEEFRCKAINDYYASVTDELDLKEGSTYTVMQTSPSGWWYAVNDDGEDGWVPSNYLVRIDSDGNDMEEDDKEDNLHDTQQNDMNNDNDNDNFNDNDNDNDDYNNKQQQTQMKQQQSQSISQPKQQQSQSISQPKQSTISQPKQQQQQQQQQQIQPQKQQQQQQTSKQQQQQQTSKPKEKTTIVVDQNKYNTTIDDGAPDKPITEWNVDETLDYLKYTSTLERRNDFKVTQACRYLTQLATDSNNCQEILAKGGLDIVFKIMQATLGDVAIQMSCCAAAVVLCANPSSKTYPATVNGIYHISQGLKDNINYRPFVVLAFNAVCNFCHDHSRHRAMALETDIIQQILKAMAHHCGKDEGYRVHSAGCLALRNMAADPKGQGAIGPDGVKVIIKGLEEYRNMKEVVEGSMGVLCNLCALAANGEAFVMQGGLQLLDNLYSDPDSTDNVRLAAASVLHNLAANEDTALLLSADQGIDLLVKILKKSEVDSVLFLNTLKVLAALLFKLPDDNRGGNSKKPEVMMRIMEKGLIAALNEAVKYDNKELQEMCATLEVVIAQTNPKLAQALADADAPAQLIPVLLNDPTPQTIHCCLAIFFHVADKFQNQEPLVEAGIFKFLTSDWYKSNSCKEDTVRISCGVFIKFFSNVKNSNVISQFEKEIQDYIKYNKEKRPNLKDLLNAIDSALKQLDPMSGQLHVQESYQQQEKKKEDKKEKKEDLAPNTKEIKSINRQSKVEQPQITPQKVESKPLENKSGKTHEDEEPTTVPTVDDNKKYSYEELKNNPSLAPKNYQEAYMKDEDFERVFGMEKEEFYKLRPWKQKQLKKAKGLF